MKTGKLSAIYPQTRKNFLVQNYWVEIQRKIRLGKWNIMSHYRPHIYVFLLWMTPLQLIVSIWRSM